MKRRLKAIGIIFGVTVLIAVLYLGISKLIEIHVASEMVGGSSPNTNGAESAFPVIPDGLLPMLGSVWLV